MGVTRGAKWGEMGEKWLVEFRPFGGPEMVRPASRSPCRNFGINSGQKVAGNELEDDDVKWLRLGVGSYGVS